MLDHRVVPWPAQIWLEQGRKWCCDGRRPKHVSGVCPAELKAENENCSVQRIRRSAMSYVVGAFELERLCAVQELRAQV